MMCGRDLSNVCEAAIYFFTAKSRYYVGPRELLPSVVGSVVNVPEWK